MRSTVNKEIDRSKLEFGSELGAGEFGAVFEGTKAETLLLLGEVGLSPRAVSHPMFC